MIEIREDKQVEVFISLAQDDGRLVHGQKYPYQKTVLPVNFSVIKVETKDRIEEFPPQKTLRPDFISTVTQYKEVSLRLQLEKGLYLVVPSTSKPNMEGLFYLSFYYNCNDSVIKLRRLRTEHMDSVDLER